MKNTLLVVFMQVVAFAITSLLGLLTSPMAIFATILIGLFGAWLVWALSPITSKIFG